MIKTLSDRFAEDRLFRLGEPQALTCDVCGRHGDAHCFARFSFRGEVPTFRCVPCVESAAERVRQCCRDAGIELKYEDPE